MLLTPDGFLPTWALLTISILGNGADLAAGIIILRREGYWLTPKALRDRIHLRFPGMWWKWVAALVIFVVAVGLGMFTSQFSADLATVPGFIPPDWFPASMNPLKEVNSAQDAFPDINFAGNYLFFFEFGIRSIVFNIIGEELYYSLVVSLSNQALPFDGLCGIMASKMNRYFAIVARLRPIVNVGAETRHFHIKRTP